MGERLKGRARLKGKRKNQKRRCCATRFKVGKLTVKFGEKQGKALHASHKAAAWYPRETLVESLLFCLEIII